MIWLARVYGSLSTDRLIAAHLRLASEALEAAAALSKLGNRNAAYEAAQALEQVILAIAQAEHVAFGRSQHHQLDTMVRLLPTDNVFKRDLAALTWLETFATAFRYPKTSGSLRERPPQEQLEAAVEQIGHIIERCALWFGVDLQFSSKAPATRTDPPRS